jgi:hypothetical protein
MSGRIDVEGLKMQADLGVIVEHYLGAPVRVNGRWLWWRCPFHEEKSASFGVTPDDGRFKCFGCGVIGDVFEFVQRMERLGENPRDFIKAAEKVAALVGTTPLRGSAARTKRRAGATKRQTRAPGARWQEAARRVVAQAERWLWDPVGAGARRYLMEHRGLTEATIRAWRLGWWPNTTYEAPEGWGLDRQRDVWLPQGLVMPGIVGAGRSQVARDGTVWYVKFRPAKRVGFSGKYYGVPGGRTALLGSDAWDDDLDLMLLEGEMDFYTVWQVLRGYVNAGTLGGAAKGRQGEAVQFGRWMGAVLRFDRIYAAFDLDTAGQQARDVMAGASERIVPVAVPYGEDVNGFYVMGGDLRTWWGTVAQSLQTTQGRAKGARLNSGHASMGAAGRRFGARSDAHNKREVGAKNAPTERQTHGFPVTLVFEPGEGLAIAGAYRELPDGRIAATFESREALEATIEATKAIGMYPGVTSH